MQANPPLATQVTPAWRTVATRVLIWLLVVLPLGVSLMTDAVVCPSARFLGTPCPGCGLTRATYAALSGDWVGAFALHPLFPLVTPFYVIALVYGSWLLLWPSAMSTRDPRRERWITRVGLAYVVVIFLMIGVWAARFFGAFGGPVPVGDEAVGHHHPIVNTAR
ncbi:MAG: DUF2752 domain-containing protein [Polyangiaceae bacterium]|nr:DUF2752 domain-containing protein [Polyangiaceae bacterium]MCW5791690.1 DUF2752 domain-containing protein [Polyangiaceae bacterium]